MAKILESVRDGILRAFTFHVFSPIAAIVVTFALGVLMWVAQLPLWAILIICIGVLCLLVLLLGGLIEILEKYRARQIYFEIEYDRPTSPYRVSQYLTQSEIDPATKKDMEKFSEDVRQKADPMFPAIRFRVGVINKTGETIRNTRLELTKFSGEPAPYLPALLKRIDSDSAAMNLGPKETGYFEVVVVPDLSETGSRYIYGGGNAPRGTFVQITKPDYHTMLTDEKYEIQLTARGDDVPPKSEWFRVEKKENEYVFCRVDGE